MLRLRCNHVYLKWISNYNVRKMRQSSNFPVVSLIYKENGDPVKVLHAIHSELAPLEPTEVSVRMLMAPINPSDLNMIQGVYPIKPKLPAIGGNEGVGQIIEIGSQVSQLQPGDWVVPADSGWGTWRTFAVSTESELIKIANDIPVVAAASMAVNPCTAFRLLNDFANLEPGDLIIQNGANSSVGQSVIQIAATMGVVTLNVVRERKDITPIVKYLQDLGATHVITDEFLRSQNMKTMMKYLPKAKLALNCVGGKSTANLLKYMDRAGTMVTYGGMSKSPMIVPAGPAIFNDVILRGFWMTAWNKAHQHSEQRRKMWETLSHMVRSGALKAPSYKLVNMKKYHEAVENSMQPYIGEKQILVIDEALL